jgi:ribosomal protein S18 acetylase RimI-like enzyme
VTRMGHTLRVARTEVIIRPAAAADRDALYGVCLHTGHAGDDASGLLADGDLYGHVYAGQYLLLEPAFALVADFSGDVKGYVLGALDTTAFETRCEAEWWPRLREQYPLPAVGTAVDRQLVGLIHRPYVTDARLVERYPSHLHINLLPAVQGMGLGAALVESLLQRLTAAGSVGVHLGVDPRNEHAIGFYEHLGFTRRDHDNGVLFTRRLP